MIAALHFDQGYRLEFERQGSEMVISIYKSDTNEQIAIVREPLEFFQRALAFAGL